MTQKNFQKLVNLGAIAVLGWNLIATKNALAIIYDVDVDLSGFTATGTIETSGVGDFINGDFTFTDWLIDLNDGNGNIFTLGGPGFGDSITNNGGLEIGDIIATNSSLSFDLDTSGDFTEDGFMILNSFGFNDLCLGLACGTVGGGIVVNGVGSNTFSTATWQASASVPFEFSPTLGLLAVGGLISVSHLCKSVKSHKIN